TRQLLDDSILPPTNDQTILLANHESNVLLYGCAAEDAFDELALEMFRQLLGPSPWPMQTISTDALVGETVTRLPADHPAVVVISALPPGGIARTRYLCKRLRGNPAVHVLVGCWGLTDEVKETRERLLSAGANHVAVTMLETRDQLKPLLQSLNSVANHHELAASR